MRPTLAPSAIASLRARLTEIATRIFEAEGADALSLRRLAGEANISRSTPYGYFEDKEEIVDSIRAAGFDRLTARTAVAIEGASGPLAQMRALGHAVLCFARDEPSIYSLMFGRPVFHGDVAPVLARAIERFRDVSRPPLDEALRRGLVRGDPDVLRRVTWAAFHGLITLHLHGHFESDAQLESDFDALNHVVGFGILTAPEPKAALRRGQPKRKATFQARKRS